jgi:hypothetical protein
MFRRTILSALFIALALTAHDEPQQDQPGKVSVHRSTKARRAFKREHPCPATGESTGRCPGYVIDHVVPLERGGPDDPSNMQWQTVEDDGRKTKLNGSNTASRRPFVQSGKPPS